MDEQTIFTMAIEKKTPPERAAFLDRACGDNAELRRGVDLLLKAHEKAGSFLESPPAVIAPTLDPPAEKLGTHIDRYKLVHEIGHGGMGMVYMAVQKTPVKRKVALKIIKPGMDTAEVVARFEAERQALALMDHPCVAHVLDGGSTESGRPYFVMELVEGTPITEYCDACPYTTRQRLELFVQVCHAVQHAHQKGIIHRDLKPSNVLVTTLDDRAVPKVIDFGIAKAVHGQLTDHSVYTQVARMMGTPMYMSPEQAQRTGQDVDTRTDVYSLGVLLYELLTGTTPFDSEQLKRSSPEEVKRIIREEDPPRPSTRLSTVDAALETISETHRADLRTLTRELTGELDWIVMKALEKDRSRRYESASDFAKDVQRYLDDEPVEACPPSTAYRLGKFYRRNKTALAFAATLALTLLIGAAFATGQAVRATEAEGEAITQQGLAEERLSQTEEQRQRAEANLTLAMQALDEVYLKAIGEEKLLREEAFSSGTGEIAQSPPEFSELERELLRRGLSFYDRFAQQNHGDPGALFETGKAFYRVALLQTGLDENGEAQNAYAEAISRLKRLTQEYPSESVYFLELGKTYWALGQLSRWWPSATDTFSESKAALDRAIELAPRNIEAYLLRSKVHNTLTQYEEAIGDLEAAVNLDSEDASLHHGLARLLNGIQDGKRRDYERALHHAQEAVKLAPANGKYRDLLATILSSRFHGPESAAEVWNEMLEVTTKRMEEYRVRMKAAELRNDYEAVIENIGRLLEKNDRQYWLYYKRAKAYRNISALEEARADLKRAEETIEERVGKMDWDPKSLASTYLNIAREYGYLGDHDKSFACLARAEQLSPNDIYLYEDRSGVYNSQGLYEKALADANKGVELAPQRSWIRKRRANAFFHLNRFDEALADIAKAVELTPNDISNLTWIPPSQAAACPNESFRTGLLELADKTIELTNDSAKAYGARGWLLSAFGEEEKALADLKSAFDRVPDTDESVRLGSSETCSTLSHLCGELAHRKEVIPYLVRMTKLLPKQPIVWYRCALAQLGSSEADAYKATCRGMVEAFRDGGSPAKGYWLAWTCLLAPAAVEDYAPVVRLAEQAVEADPMSDSYLKTLGGVLYRAGRFEDAIQQLTKADDLIEDPESESTSSPAYTWYLLAMAHHELGNDAEAKQWVDKATAWTDRVLAEHEAGTSVVPWNRRLTLKLLREEAEGMIGTSDQLKDDTQTEQEEGQEAER